MVRPRPIARDRLTGYLDGYLRVGEITDDSPNGLQVEGAARLASVAFAVDASLRAIRSATRSGAGMLIVHHGLFWGRHQQVVGSLRSRLSALLSTKLSLYAAHLPLDCHPSVGNNAELARLLGLTVEAPFARYKGTDIGVVSHPPKPLRSADLARSLELTLGERPDMHAFGPAAIRRIGIVTGGGAMFADDAKAAGCDTLITGEASHTGFLMAREARVNVFFGGHYATETLGLQSLRRHLYHEFSLPGRFINSPTGY